MFHAWQGEGTYTLRRALDPENPTYFRQVLKSAKEQRRYLLEISPLNVSDADKQLFKSSLYPAYFLK